MSSPKCSAFKWNQRSLWLCFIRTMLNGANLPCNGYRGDRWMNDRRPCMKCMMWDLIPDSRDRRMIRSILTTMTLVRQSSDSVIHRNYYYNVYYCGCLVSYRFQFWHFALNVRMVPYKSGRCVSLNGDSIRSEVVGWFVSIFRVTVPLALSPCQIDSVQRSLCHRSRRTSTEYNSKDYY